MGISCVNKDYLKGGENLLIEFCAENFTFIEEAINRGVDRIELCDHLSCGGTTPSYGVVKKTVQVAHTHNVQVVTMVRPRSGDFCYTEDELAIMIEDIQQLNRLDVDGLVMGALTKNNQIDLDAMKQLMRVAQSDVIFHMAFDLINAEDKKDAIDQCIALGVKRILLHGSQPDCSVLDNKDEINDLIDYANGALEFIVGKGIKKSDLAVLKDAVNTDQFHGTKIY